MGWFNHQLVKSLSPFKLPNISSTACLALPCLALPFFCGSTEAHLLLFGNSTPQKSKRSKDFGMVVFVLGVSVGTSNKKSPGKNPHLRAERSHFTFCDVQTGFCWDDEYLVEFEFFRLFNFFCFERFRNGRQIHGNCGSTFLANKNWQLEVMVEVPTLGKVPPPAGIYHFCHWKRDLKFWGWKFNKSAANSYGNKNGLRAGLEWHLSSNSC